MYDARETVKASMLVEISENGTFSVRDLLGNCKTEPASAEEGVQAQQHTDVPLRRRRVVSKDISSTKSNVGSRENTLSATRAERKYDQKKASARSYVRVPQAVHPLPNQHIREASFCFERAVLASLVVVSARSKVEKLLEQICRDTECSSSG